MERWPDVWHKSGIYRWTCLPTGRCYVGSAKRLGIRRLRHTNLLNAGSHPNVHFQRAWAKHGPQAFRFDILLVCAPGDMLLYEQRAIDILVPELNILRTAGNSLGRKYTPEGLAAITAANRRRGADPAFRALRSALMKGVSPSPEQRAKLSAALKGRPRPPEVIAKIRAGHAARRAAMGSPAPAAGVARRKGYSKDSAWRAALSRATKGKPKRRRRSVSPGQLTLEV